MGHRLAFVQAIRVCNGLAVKFPRRTGQVRRATIALFFVGCSLWCRQVCFPYASVQSQPDSCRETRREPGGERGIRTPDRAFRPYNGLANRRLQPLGHLSGSVWIIPGSLGFVALRACFRSRRENRPLRESVP